MGTENVIIVNDVEATLGERTLWTRLREWTGATFIGGNYESLADVADNQISGGSVIIRNASWFGPLKSSQRIPTVGIVQDLLDGPGRVAQELVAATCKRVVFNSEWTRTQYPDIKNGVVIPLPVDFALFDVGNRLGLQQVLGIPDKSVLWVGAAHGPAAHLKGYDTFIQVARDNPDLQFIAVFKDEAPDYMPFNVKGYVRIDQQMMARLMAACCVILCTSRVETQHLAGIEAGACGTPVVAPGVGVYHNRYSTPGAIVPESTSPMFSAAVRSVLASYPNRQETRAYWQAEFGEPVIKEKWLALISEVANG